MKQAYLLFSILFSSTILWPNHSMAEAALAVGLPPDVAEKKGFAYGWATNKASPQEAKAAALKDCRGTGRQGPADKRAEALCAVINTFHDQCVAVAMDPKNATPGVGWAISPTLEEAERQAVIKCRATAGEKRRDYCNIDHSICDGSAK